MRLHYGLARQEEARMAVALDRYAKTTVLNAIGQCYL